MPSTNVNGLSAGEASNCLPSGNVPTYRTVTVWPVLGGLPVPTVRSVYFNPSGSVTVFGPAGFGAIVLTGGSFAGAVLYDAVVSASSGRNREAKRVMPPPSRTMPRVPADRTT